MAILEAKNIDSPDERREFVDKGHADIVHLEAGSFGRGTFDPGWRWSEHVKPLAGTDSCQAHHRGYVVSGRMKVVMDDGTEEEVGPGDIFDMPPGHDAWTVGEEPCVLMDFQGFASYAKPS